MGGSAIFHSPWSLALVTWVAEPSCTVTVSPGFAHPQIMTGFSRWNTMWLPNTWGRRISARAFAGCQAPPRITNSGIIQPAMATRGKIRVNKCFIVITGRDILSLDETQRHTGVQGFFPQGRLK